MERFSYMNVFHLNMEKKKRSGKFYNEFNPFFAFRIIRIFSSDSHIIAISKKQDYEFRQTKNPVWI